MIAFYYASAFGIGVSVALFGYGQSLIGCGVAALSAFTMVMIDSSILGPGQP